MRDYRLYRLDGAGKIASAEWLSAEDDTQAAVLAREAGFQSTVEIWDRKRLVIRIEPETGAGG